MKRSHLIIVGALVLAPAAALAQPGAPPPAPQGYYSQPNQVPGGFHDRTGRMALGFSFGLGGMNVGDKSVDCPTCDYSPVAGEFDMHIGGMLNPRLALLFEVQGNAQTIDDQGVYGTTSLVQGTLMGAAQYWLMPQLWLKGGIGLASLQYSYDQSNAPNDQIDSGAALMAGAGYELFSAQNFAVDLQARIITAEYKSLDQNLTSGTIGVGFNWY